MPRIRVRLPVTVDVTEEKLAAVKSVGDLVAKARSVGLVAAASDVVDKAQRAIRRRRR